MTGTVEAVSLSPAHGFSKSPQLFVRLVAGEGVEGDAHRGVTTQHLYRMRKDPTQPNLCQVHLFAAEMLDEVAAAGFDVKPGEVGENVLTRGLDLLSMPLGTKLLLGAEVVLEVTGLRTPCSRIDDYQNGLQAQLWGERDAFGKKIRRAGIMGIVVVGGELHPGDSIRVEFPAEPHIPLGPV